MIRFKPLLNKFHILTLFFAFALLFVSFVPGVSIAQENYKIVFDETRLFQKECLISETDASGGYLFAEALQNNGFSVSQISDKPITYEKLQEYNVLVILGPADYYNKSEIDAIEKFVRDGGGLLLALRRWRGSKIYAANAIAQRFGVSFAADVTVCDARNFYSQDSKNVVKISDIKSHAITQNVSSFYLVDGTYIIESGSSDVLAYTSSEAWLDSVYDNGTLTWGNKEKDPNEIEGSFLVLSEMTYVNGTIVFIGGYYFLSNEWIDYLDNEQLGLNIVKWLAELSTNATSPSIPTSPATSNVSAALRIAGIVVITALLFAGVIFQIRRDRRREKLATKKLVQGWKITALLFGHLLGLICGLALVIWGLVATGLERYLYLFGLIPSCFITGMILRDLVNHKLHKAYSYFIICLFAFSIIFSAFWGSTFASADGSTAAAILITTLFYVPFLIPNLVSLLIIKIYGTELTIKGIKVPVRGPTTKTLPVELRRDYPASEYLGEGGFACVFRATRKDGKMVAVKVPKSSDAKTGKLFIREVSNWSTLEHDNIVRLNDFNIFPIPYLEMELCNGSLEPRRRNVEEAISIVADIAEGLKYAHKEKIIHGDIKPSNILIKDGKIKISDWGLSKVKRERSISLSGITPQYAAPEQVSAEFGKADERTDIYQLGAVFYELVTERPPFEGELSAIYHSIVHDQPVPPSGVNPLCKSVEHIIMKCLNKRKEERYQSIDEFLKELGDYEPGSITSDFSDENMKAKTLEFRKGK